MWAPRVGVSVGSRRLRSRNRRRTQGHVDILKIGLGRWYMLGWLGRARKERENIAANRIEVKEAKPKSKEMKTCPLVVTVDYYEHRRGPTGS